MWKGWSRKKYGFEIRRDMWKVWKDQLVELSRPNARCAKELFFFHRLVNIEGTSGRSFGGSTNGFGLKEEDSAYTLPILEKITVRFFSFFIIRYLRWSKAKHHQRDRLRQVKQKSTFRVSRWSSPQTTTCWKAAMATGLPVSTKTFHLRFGLKPKERQSWRYLSRILRPAFHRMSQISS